MISTIISESNIKYLVNIKQIAIFSSKVKKMQNKQENFY